MTSGESETTGAGQTAISDRERFLKACRSEPLDYPPMWMMRQAGRSLPEYMAVKEKHTFVEIVQTPELATEVKKLKDAGVSKTDAGDNAAFTSSKIVFKNFCEYSERKSKGITRTEAEGLVNRLISNTPESLKGYINGVDPLAGPKVYSFTVSITNPNQIAFCDGGQCDFSLLITNPDFTIDNLTKLDEFSHSLRDPSAPIPSSR